jgi:hypothetical protein
VVESSRRGFKLVEPDAPVGQAVANGGTVDHELRELA